MGSRGQALCFALLAALAACSIFVYSTNTPAFQSDSLSTKCFLNPNAQRYAFLPPFANQLLCTLNTVFQASTGSPQAMILANIFSRSVYVTSAIMAYESFRQPGFFARRGQFWMAISQVASIGTTLPLYLGLAVSRKREVMAKRPRPEQIWSVFISLLAGYVLPTWYIGNQNWSYDSLSLWQIYPVYMIILNILLPPILRPFLKNSSSSYPIYAIATFGIFLSCDAHYRMLGSGVDFRDIMHVFSQPEGLTSDVHFLFLCDFLASLLAAVTHVILSFVGETGERKFGYCIVLAAMTNIVGPGGALAFVWAIREIWGIKLAQQEVKVGQVKKTQ